MHVVDELIGLSLPYVWLLFWVSVIVVPCCQLLFTHIVGKHQSMQYEERFEWRQQLVTMPMRSSFIKLYRRVPIRKEKRATTSSDDTLPNPLLVSL
ncbi:hypothetical protein [Brevibacillus laterosporus]|uniref:hypothetical protein n=1 Tax=Brevibacillus laterosporus TaxID=1465 RepID=UPI00264AA667|nr:hypothetical protein [Brevibacillus laterosporus]MDN9009581.1 hypothetical protein [Brevibacillus laterosporus]MDO0940420.1 hypothetical protein [Brevibacillus laterosporus]